jgi:3-oxoacyl-[acyl-carrier protein] reductase
MLLADKSAVVYGAGGAVGSAVARAFAAEGARVFLAGRTRASLETVGDEITGQGGWADVAQLDALDEAAIDAHMSTVVEQTGRIDVSFNAISCDHIQGAELIEMSRSDVTGGLEARVATNFLTARAAARHMAVRGTGVILTFSARPDLTRIPRAASFGIANAALEGLSRSLAVELGPRGIRVVCLRSAGSPDAPGVDEVFAMHADGDGLSRTDFDAAKADRTLLHRLPLLREVANAAALMASDHASAMTGAIANVTCGELVD